MVLQRTIALVRMATAVFFLFFGEYKVFDRGFAHGGFQNYLHGYITESAVALYRPVLAKLVLPHAVFFAYVVGVVELAIGLTLLFGIWVRFGSVLGMLHMTSLALATWWGPGRGVPTWRYFGAQLDHLPLLLLFFIFYAADPGRAGTVRGWARGKHLRAFARRQGSRNA